MPGMRVLLSFNGFQNPYTKGLIGDEQQLGPVLTLLAARSFDQVVLFSTPRTTGQTTATMEAIASRGYEIPVNIVGLDLDDPTDYRSILVSLRKHCLEILDQSPGAELFISTASGTAQMHACWLLLTVSGEIPAKLLHARRPEFVSENKPRITTVDPTAIAFPQMRITWNASLKENTPQDEAVSPPSSNVADIIDEIGLVAEHKSMQLAIERAAAAAPFGVPILLSGETGTGKDLFATLIHRVSGRRKERFVPVNCAAIPADLVESTLFGHKRGAFTGAVNDLKGKFELADEGTLFLDEIGELPLKAQAKLLRVLEDAAIEAIGSNERKRVNVRVIAASNHDLYSDIREGRFREDLYYRLHGATIVVPPLRDRRSEIPRLALHFLHRINETLAQPRQLSVDALSRLQLHSWPGNVREFRAVIHRAVMFSRGRVVLGADDIVFDQPSERDIGLYLPEPGEGFNLNEFLSEVRTILFRRALAAAHQNQSQAARMLGVTSQAVSNFLKSGDFKATS